MTLSHFTIDYGAGLLGFSVRWCQSDDFSDAPNAPTDFRNFFRGLCRPSGSPFRENRAAASSIVLDLRKLSGKDGLGRE